MLKWLFIVIIAIIVEFLTVDLVSIWIVAGGLAGLLLSLIKAPLWMQWIGFIVVTIGVALLVKPFGKEFLRGNVEKTNIDRYIGKHVKLTKTITEEEPGELKLNNEIWRAISMDHETIQSGDEVVIMKIDGNKLIVRK